MKKHALIFCTALFLVLPEILAAVDVDNIIAYPVPFNPRRGTLTITFKDTSLAARSYSIKLEIYDINGDQVLKKKLGGSLPVYWNGHNDNGNMVKPGLYIVKIGIEDNTNHSEGKKFIRILINY